MREVKALVFDVFGTLVDWRSAIAREARAALSPLGVALDWDAFADAWRDQYQPAMDEVRSGRIPFSKLDVLHRRNLDVVLRNLGLDNVDVQSAKQRGLLVLNTPAAPSTSVAELTVGLMLSLLRKIPFADREMKEGRWVKNQLIGEELQGKRVGVIGRAGRIGSEVARILTVGFQVDVLGYDVIRPKGVPGVTYEFAESLEELLREADIVTIHVPYAPETHRLLGQDRLRMMRRGSYLVNTSRGDIVDGPTILELLKSGHLAGAALDVDAQTDALPARVAPAKERHRRRGGIGLSQGTHLKVLR